MRISTFKTVLRQRLLSLCLLLSLPFLAQSQVLMTVQTTPGQQGDMVTADFRVVNFTDILSSQFSILWDAAALEFQNVHSFHPNLNGLAPNNFGVTQTSAGILTFSWFDSNIAGVTLPFCESLFSISFQLVGTSIPPISITGTPTPVEVVQMGGSTLQLLQGEDCTEAGNIIGKVYHDADYDCLPANDETKLANWKIKAVGNGYTFYGTSSADGEYKIFALPGEYLVSVILPDNGLWSACQPVQTATVTTNQAVQVDFAAQALMTCPAMEVELSTAFLRRCFNSRYFVSYCNQGTAAAENAQVEITFDPFLEVVESSLPWSAAVGQTYTFQLGNVAVGECGSFQVDLMVSCNAVLGQTHCTSAHIYPDTLCIPLNLLWDGSNLEVSGTCEGDSVRFQITNTGEDMATPAPFIVIEDDMVNLTSDPVLLNNMEELSVAFPANGSTWRLEFGQGPYSPFNNTPSASVEGCGTNGNGAFSTGFVTQFPLNDDSPFVDEDCRENIGAFDPNDKTGFPKGFCAAHYIKAGRDIEYLIRFQNTGTDTAFNIVIRDTLSSLLDPATVRPGVSSHPCDFELLSSGILQFTFKNIMLPDSNVNEAASHGFVKFRVSQLESNAAGGIIENQAAIYFDFNEPVFTNRYKHTVGDNFMGMTTGTGDLSLSGFVNAWYDVPVEGVEMTLTDVCPVYTDANGYFLFSNLDTAVYTLTASKMNDNLQEGVTVLDILKLRSAILGIQPFQTLYQQLAADVNSSNSVTTFDAVILMKMALGIPVDGNLGTHWRFLDANATPPSSVIQFNPLEMSLDNQNFLAVKPGNVLTEEMVEKSPLMPLFYFVPVSFDGELLTVDVRAKNFTQVNGFQFGLQWNAAVLEFSSAQGAALTPLPWEWFYVPAPGKLSLLVLNDLGQTSTLPDDATLFKLKFKALSAMGSVTPMTLDTSNLPFQVVVEDCKLATGIVQNATVAVEEPSATGNLEVEGFSLKIAPNPVRSGFPVFAEIMAETARMLTFQIFDPNGVQIENRKEFVQAGKTTVRLSRPLQQGIFVVKVSDENGKRLVLKLVVY